MYGSKVGVLGDIGCTDSVFRVSIASLLRVPNMLGVYIAFPLSTPCLVTPAYEPYSLCANIKQEFLLNKTRARLKGFRAQKGLVAKIMNSLLQIVPLK